MQTRQNSAGVQRRGACNSFRPPRSGLDQGSFHLYLLSAILASTPMLICRYPGMSFNVGSLLWFGDRSARMRGMWFVDRSARMRGMWFGDIVPGSQPHDPFSLTGQLITKWPICVEVTFNTYKQNENNSLSEDKLVCAECYCLVHVWKLFIDII